jgi:hypothetical protein
VIVMGRTRLRTVLRLAAALCALAGAAALLGYAGPRDWPHGSRDLGRWLGAGPPESRVVAFATVAAYGCLVWLAVALVAVAAGRAAWVPGALRRLAERVLGVALVSAAVGVLAAGSAAAGVSADGPFDRPAPAPPPPRPVQAVPAVPAVPADGVVPADGAVGAVRAAQAVRTVRPGDTLWGIAGPAWPRWYAANRRAVGPDPDLIRPGLRLVPPAGGGS